MIATDWIAQKCQGKRGVVCDLSLTGTLFLFHLWKKERKLRAQQRGKRSSGCAQRNFAFQKSSEDAIGGGNITWGISNPDTYCTSKLLEGLVR